MQLRQQIVQDRVETIAQVLHISEDQAFLRFAHSYITGESLYDDQSLTDFVDGGQDKQIDAIVIDRGSDEATVFIIQAKNTDSFSSNQLIQMHNGLSWIFNRPKAEVLALDNVALRDKIQEYRSQQYELGPSNLHIVVAFVTNGLSAERSEEFRQEERSIRYDYDNNTFASFDLRIWGADELVDQINLVEKQDRKIDAEIRMKYDANNPSTIRYYAEGLKGLVCTTTAREIARIVNEDEAGVIFDSNIRRFLGTRGAVNADILQTCTAPTLSHQFWFLNNGITIVCEQFEAITDPDTPVVKLKGMQIVNGCQTATTLALAARDNALVGDVWVLLRIYEAPSPELISKIVMTTNNQNRISSRDLKANHTVQVDMEQAFARYGYYYERKPRQYDTRTDIDTQRIMPNEQVGQCYLAVVMRKPSDGRSRKYKIWGELYDQVFSGAEIEPYILAWLIYRRTTAWLQDSGYSDDADEVRRKLATRGRFFLARMVAFLWRGGDEFKISRPVLQKQIAELETDLTILDPFIVTAFEQLEEIIKARPEYVADLERALKSSTLDTEIDRSLYSRKGKSGTRSRRVTQKPPAAPQKREDLPQEPETLETAEEKVPAAAQLALGW